MRIAVALFVKANDVVKRMTGQSIVQKVFEMAVPFITRALPALTVLIPLLRNTIIPAVENMLTSEEYAQLEDSVSTLEEVMANVTNTAVQARTEIAGLSDQEIDQWLADRGKLEG
jgi:hypothetical protein